VRGKQRSPQAFPKHVSSPEFFQQKRGVFSSKWKYLPPPLGKNFRASAISAEARRGQKIPAGTHLPIWRKIDG
jgi:hypothetical protein